MNLFYIAIFKNLVQMIVFVLLEWKIQKEEKQIYNLYILKSKIKLLFNNTRKFDLYITCILCFLF